MEPFLSSDSCSFSVCLGIIQKYPLIELIFSMSHFWNKQNRKTVVFPQPNPWRSPDSEEGRTVQERRMTDNKNDGRMKQYQVSVQKSFSQPARSRLSGVSAPTASLLKPIPVSNVTRLPRPSAATPPMVISGKRRRLLSLGYGGGGGGGGVCVCAGVVVPAAPRLLPLNQIAAAPRRVIAFSLSASLPFFGQIGCEKWTSHVLHRR